MSKRTVASLPTTPKKRAKLASDQLRLDRFFSKSPEKKVPSRSNSTSASVIQETIHLDDEKYAAALAEQGGVDLEAARQLEATWKTATTQATTLDLCSEQTEKPSSSRQARRLLPLSFRTTTESENAVLLGADDEVVEMPRTIVRSEPFQPPDVSFASDPLEFSLRQNLWPAGSPAPYGFLAHILAAVSETRSRISIINTLTNALRTLTALHPPSLLPALYLLSNTLSPPYIAVELGLGPSIISKAIQHVSGLTPASIKRLYTQKGDAGDVAFEAKSTVRTLIPHPPLLISDVYGSLLKIADSKGQGATKQKQAIAEKLLVAARGEEARFLTRTLAQNLRVGALRTSILTALARSMVLTASLWGLQGQDTFHSPLPLVCDEEVATRATTAMTDDIRDDLKIRFSAAEKLIMRVYVQHPNYADIVNALLATGLDDLDDRVPLEIGSSLQFTMTTRLLTTRLQEFLCTLP